jgi:transcriptional regulator with XRE-family HTH domain
VHPPPPVPAAAGQDPARIVEQFWESFEDLLIRFNKTREAARKPPWTWKQLAGNIAISDSTLSEWRAGRILPSTSRVLVKGAGLLGADEEDWLNRWEKAREAYVDTLEERRARRKTGIEGDHDSAAAPVPPLAGQDEPAGGPRDGHVHTDGTSTGADQPPPRSRSPRRLTAALTVTALAAAIVITITVIVPLIRGTGHPAATPPPDAGTPGQALPAALHPAMCAYVTRDNAWIFTAPSLSARKLRRQPKPVGSGITIFNGSHPPGWTPVLTPRDVPRRNWMQTDVLSTPYHGEDPCRDRT